jgi:hypothetical protein
MTQVGGVAAPMTGIERWSPSDTDSDPSSPAAELATLNPAMAGIYFNDFESAGA